MTNKEDQPIEVDFNRRDTEAGWNRIWDSFGRKATPVWFSWLTWTLLLGAQQYLFKKSHSILVAITICISVILLWFYFQAFFYGLKFKNVPVIGHFRNQRLASMIISGIMALLFWQAAIRIAMIVLKHQGG